MSNITAAQQAWDAQLPDYDEAQHRYTGDVLVGEYCFKYVDGKIVTVSYYNDADDFVEQPYTEWKGDNHMAVEADETAHTEYVKEVRHAH